MTTELTKVANTIHVHVIGPVGCGKSAMAGEIEILCKALGLNVSWPDGQSEKNMVGADWQHALEMYKPSVVIHEALTQRPAAQTERDAFEEWYAEDANKQTGKPGWFTPKEIAELRDGDWYGEHRMTLNGKWAGWQARASLPTQPAAQATPAQDVGASADYWGDLAQQKADADARRGVSMPVSYYTSSIVGALLATQQSTPEPVGEVVHQIKGEAFECPHAWRDATEEAFYTTPAADRRILYTRPAPGVPEGWAIERRTDLSPTALVVRSPKDGPGFMTVENNHANIAYRMLYRLASDLLAAAQAKGGEHE